MRRGGVVLALAGVVVMTACAPAVVVSRGPTDRGEVALTFDVAYDVSYTAAFLDVLQQYQVEATIFSTGEWADQPGARQPDGDRRPPRRQPLLPPPHFHDPLGCRDRPPVGSRRRRDLGQDEPFDEAVRPPAIWRTEQPGEPAPATRGTVRRLVDGRLAGLAGPVVAEVVKRCLDRAGARCHLHVPPERPGRPRRAAMDHPGAARQRLHLRGLDTWFP